MPVTSPESPEISLNGSPGVVDALVLPAEGEFVTAEIVHIPEPDSIRSVLSEWAPLRPACSFPVRAWRGLCLGLEWLFGLASLIVTLALLSVIPVAQFLSLGYLLEASGRIARTGQFTQGFIGIRTFARLGSIVAGTWLMLLPIRFLAGLANDAELANFTGQGGNPVTAAWRIGTLIATLLMVGHIAMCWYAGGKLRHFFWPVVAVVRTFKWFTLGFAGRIFRPLLRRIYPSLAEDLAIPVPLATWFPPAVLWQGWQTGRMYVGARDAVWEFIAHMRLRYYFWLGLRGYVGAFLWLLVPALLLLGGTRLPPGGVQFLVGWTGALMLLAVSLYLPFLQVNFAAKNRFAEMFNITAVRLFFRRAPLAYWFALLVTVAFAIPLYLLNIENIPKPLMWMPSLVFVLFIYPARLLTGWAVARGSRRPQPRFFLTRWAARFATLPVVAFYVLFVYLSQFTRWFGEASFFEQHAFLLPVPFLGL